MLKIEQSTIEPSFHVIFLNNFIFGLMLTVVAIVALKMRPLLEAHWQWRCHVKRQVTTLSCELCCSASFSTVLGSSA